MKVLLITLVMVACAVLALYVIGRLEPERHRASVSVVLPRSREVVWTALTDYAAMPQWWPAVKAVRMETLADGTVLTWNKNEHGREVAFRTTAEEKGRKLVREITGENLPFGGTWTYELSAEGSGTRLTLTEDGFIKVALMRAYAKFFMKPDATMKDFSEHLLVYLEKGK